jgi:hypothetical protein
MLARVISARVGFLEDPTMICAKWRVIAPAVAVAIMASMAWTGEAAGVTTNVVYMKDATSSVASATYFQPTIVYNALPGDYTTDWKPVPVDDIINQAPGNWFYVNRNTGYFWFDLAQDFDLTQVEITPRSASYWTIQLQGSRVLGYAADKSTIIGEFTIPSGLQGVAINYSQTVDWKGVRWLRVWDETDINGTTTDDDLLFTELRAFADVAGHTGFIGNVAVTSTSEIVSPHYEAKNLTNNRGMTDQGVSVGDPAAKSICTSGNWLSANLKISETEWAPDPVLTFDLGSKYTLSEMRIWNYNWTNCPNAGGAVTDYTYRGTKEMLIEYSADDGATYTALADTNGGELGNYTIARAAAGTYDSFLVEFFPAYNSAELVAALADLEADHIRITALSNYGDDSTTVSYRGLGEVRFYGEEVSEPIPGDATEDGKVDADDAARLASYWGSTELASGKTWWQMGDFDNSHSIDAGDASILAANWGHGTSEAGAVPEPGVIALLVGLGGFALLRRGRWRP